MDRRLLLSLIAGAVALPHLLRAVPLPPPQPPRPQRLNLNNPHTGESFSGIYRDGSGPIPTAMAELSEFLRDFHSGEKIEIDVAVLDFLSAIMREVGQNSATILSAYRTPQTNAMLARTHFGVAENSQHLYGRALDVHFGDNLGEAMKAARAMQRGGVGWYPHSGFMHIDSGPVRNWDLDHAGLGTLLVGRHRVRFNKKGDTLVSKKGDTPVNKKGAMLMSQRDRIGGGRMPAVLRGETPPSLRGRLARLHQLARAQYFARGR
jgi:uncharacterized protein YcbK (DUF882 family)